MEIKYLKKLNNYPSVQRASGNVFYLEGIPLEDIQNLETLFNNSQPFPTALRELLFIAGKYCYVLAYGVSENQSAMQQKQRNFLLRYNRLLTRPFFVVDAYNEGEMFLFVYLDESLTDPVIQQAVFDGNEDGGWLDSLNFTLSEYIDNRLTVYLSGSNPY
ncbi:hypothetical protein ABIB62_004592 [Mucilaginibacter sp. UYP25]|uniref:hypothetical protein n=1 Tax=unclassified Mucilaginibacter TaxID=2617802 RepID=UPI0033908F0B